MGLTADYLELYPPQQLLANVARASNTHETPVVNETGSMIWSSCCTMWTLVKRPAIRQTLVVAPMTSREAGTVLPIKSNRA
jgi:hypothetical protein